MAEHPTAFNPTPVDPRQVTSAQPRPNPGNVYGDKSVPVSGWNKIKDGLQRLFPGGPYAAEYGITDRSSVLQVPYSADPVPEPVAPPYPPEQTTASIGASGTPILAGFLEDLGEYNSKLSGQNAFPTYEKMRRSDPDCAAGLMATKLPIKAARAEIVPGVGIGGTDRNLATEIAEFVKDNLFGGLETMTSTGFTQTQTFESVIDNALLMLDFGCACDEILWTIDGNHVRARKLAPRLPMTFFRYWPDTDGDTLLALEQYGYRGNALLVTTPIPGPNGWKLLGDLEIGDMVFDESGAPAKVTAKSPVFNSKPCFKVSFSDGTNLIAADDHLWTVWDETTRMCYSHRTGAKEYPANWWEWTGANISGRLYTPADDALIKKRLEERCTAKQIAAELGRSVSAIQQHIKSPKAGTKRRSGAATLTTSELALRVKKGRSYNYAIPFTEPVPYSEKALPLDPYVLGYLLGDGNSNGSGVAACTPEDKTLLMAEFEKAGHPCNPWEKNPLVFYMRNLVSVWGDLGLYNNKHIPDIYRLGSIEQRIALLQGLIDSDGHTDVSGEYGFTNTNPRLAYGVAELARSLGIKAKVRPIPSKTVTFKGRTVPTVTKPSFVVLLTSTIPLSRLSRKLAKACHDWNLEQHARHIVSIEPAETVPTQCITVDSPSHLYLAGEAYIPTHNSYVNVIVPAEKLNYYAYRKEGAIFTGRSALRECYQPWYIKSNLYRIDSTGLERNAMGIPHIQLPQPHTREDKEAALNIVTRLAVQHNTGVVTGAGMDFKLVGITGRVRDPKLSIQHQSEQLLRAFLAGFIAFGTTQTGARNLGAEMVGFFKLGLNSLARNVASTITHGVIRKLVDYNFGDSRKKIPYPQLKFSNIVAIDFLDAVDKIKGLGQWQTDFIQPSDELENTILQELGFPLKTKPRVRWMPAQIRDMLQPTTNETVAEMEYGVGAKKDDEVGPIHPTSGEPGQQTPKTPKPGTEPRAKRTEPKGDVGPMQPAVPAIPKNKMPAGPDVDAHKKSALKPPGSPARNKDFKATEQFLSILKFLATDVKTKEKWAKKRGMVDFDGVLNKHPVHDFVPGQFGELIPEGKKFVEAAQAMGYEVHVLTARKDHKDVMGWLLDHGVKVAQVTSKKIPAAWYVDDRGAHFSTDDPNAADQVLAAIKQIEEDHREKIPG